MIYRIPKTQRHLFKKILGFFTFQPCECGCTNGYGIGLNLVYFGMNFQYKYSVHPLRAEKLALPPKKPVAP